jgi:hypothetical protein
MGGFDWIGVAAASAGVGIGLVAVDAFSRRRTARRTAQASPADASEPTRRIDVVAIDEEAASTPGTEKP